MAWRRIFGSRQNQLETGRVSTFRVSKINRDATNFTEMMEWQTVTFQDTVYTKELPADTIVNMIKTKNFG